MYVGNVTNQDHTPYAGGLKAASAVPMKQDAAIEAVKKGLARMQLDKAAFSEKPADTDGILTPLTETGLEGLFRVKPQKLSTEFTSENVSEAAKGLAALMDENDERMLIQTDCGMSGEQIAQEMGEIGRKLDASLEAGEITRQEYDDLNKGLAKYTEVVASRAERTAAKWEIMRQMARETLTRVKNGASRQEMALYAEKNKKEFHSRVAAFVEQFCSVDRAALLQLINSVRGGEDLFPEGTVQRYGPANLKGFFKNGYVPVQSIEV